MSPPFDPTLTRRVALALGPLFAVPITAPAAVDKFAAIGFDRDDWGERYFAFRSAPLGRATAEAVIATYFNFAPRRINRYVPRIWEIAEPELVLDVLMDSVDTAMGSALGEAAASPAVLELAGLLSEAAASAFARPEGRPLFAGIAAIAWPDAPPAQIWLGMHALREFRGDGHIAALTSRGLTGIEALVLHEGTGELPEDLLRSSRAWPRPAWAEALEELRGRDLIARDGRLLSAKGQEYREQIETHTDELAVPAYTRIGAGGVERILELAPPIVEAVSRAAGRITRSMVARGLPDDGAAEPN